MKQKIIFILSLLFGLMFINAGLDKFFHYMPLPPDLPEKMSEAWNAFDKIGWVMPLVGFAEILGGLLFIIPKTRVLGALIIFPIVIGILFSTATSSPSGLPMALIILLINLWVFFENRERILPLIKKPVTHGQG